ncbi:MAG: hypothetical protein CMP88_08365 [Gammaproteobacteria bacterium]|nr:hypothetical protein [Gammaproteobacteria bacterium]
MKTINRRSFLRGTGVVLALPLLDIMGPQFANASSPTRRMINICCTLGLYRDSWMPKDLGRNYTPSEYLSIIDRHREKYTIFSGLSHEEQTGRQAHNSEITWLTSARHPGMDGFQNSISLDQTVADHLGYVTRYPSVVLGTLTPQSQSYDKNGVMIPAQTSPAEVFKQMFIQGTPEEVEKESQRINDGGSILDNLKTQARTLQNSGSSEDRQKLEAYFEAVRAAEIELSKVRDWMDRPKPGVDSVPPVDNADPADILGRIDLWLELMPLILATDSSRVISLMIQDHGVVPKLPGITADQHNLSHHGQDPGKIAQLRQLETEIVKRFGLLMDSLDGQKENDSSLLDQTQILFGSNLGNANSHNAENLPILVAGGDFAHGSHIAHDEKHNAPLCNLYLSLIQQMGVETDQFGQSTSTLNWG